MDENDRIRVLVVDDHAVFAESLVRALRDEPDIEIVGTAGTAVDAVRECQATKPDVVLLDYELPDGDGASTTRRLRELVPSAQVVVLTGFGDETRLVDAIDAGCAGFITKDKPIQEVVEAIRKVPQGEVLISGQLLARLLPRLRQRPQTPTTDLSGREVEVLELVAQGLSNKEIAERLVISPFTARNHVQNVLTKLGAHSKLEAVALAARAGIISTPGGG